jgi:hypothetical protein
MTSSGKIYITYNSANKTHIEESTALRLQTLSSLYGINVSLPHRATLKFEKDFESQNRIQTADYIVVFSLTTLSLRLKDEIAFAKKLQKPIIIIYDKLNPISILKSPKIKFVELDKYNSDGTLRSVTEFLQKELQKKNKPTIKEKEDTGLGVALLGIGLGLLALALISENGKK